MLVFEVEVYGRLAAMTDVASALEELEGTSRVRRIEATRAAHSLVAATIRPTAVARSA